MLGAGASLLTLRALGAFRTLVLLDGRRITPSQPTGATDANLIPQSLVKRVDVVTGGASAAYGSDAVSGVVNFVLDTKFTGIKANLQGGISSRGDAGTMKAGLTIGKSFADDRLNIVFAADYLNQEGIGVENFGGRQWAEAQWGVIGVNTTSTALIVAWRRCDYRMCARRGGLSAKPDAVPARRRSCRLQPGNVCDLGDDERRRWLDPPHQPYSRVRSHQSVRPHPI